MDKLIDWSDFEEFVQMLYETEGELVVERDVTEVGKSGAKRQIDVKVTQNTRFHSYVTIIECKRWKEKVNRGLVDILAASVEDLNASKGVLFTTTGYEKGAKEYAESKNIDIFIIRDLTLDEWGRPGRVIQFYMQYCGGKFLQFDFPNAQLLPIVEDYPTHLDIKIDISDNQKTDSKFDLCSVIDGSAGPNLIEIVKNMYTIITNNVCNKVQLIKDGAECLFVVKTAGQLDLSNYQYRQLRFPYGVVNLPIISFLFATSINQTEFKFDRGKGLDLAVVVENYLNDNKHYVVQRKGGDSSLSVIPVLQKTGDPAKDVEKPLENGSILKIFLEPWVYTEHENADQRGLSNAFFLSLVERDGKMVFSFEKNKLNSVLSDSSNA